MARACALVALALALAAPAARAELAVPPLRARVNDDAGVLSPAQAQALERKLAAFERETTHQIVVLTVPSLEGDPIEDFSIRVVEAWKLGRADVDNGIFVVVAPNDRQVRIEVGRGLEGVVPDVIASRVIRNAMIPRFQAGDVAGGIGAGVDALAAAAKGEVVPAPETPPPGWRGGGPSPLAIVLFASVFGATASAPFRRRRPVAALVAGGIAAFLTWSMLGAAVLWIVLAIVGGVLGGVVFPLSGGSFGGGLPRGGALGGWGPGWGSGGWSSGGSRGGFGGGGGGSFGGGGASGRW